MLTPANPSFTFQYQTPDLGGSISTAWSGSCFLAIPQNSAILPTNINKINNKINLNDLPNVQCSYEWKGWNIVEKRVYYSCDIWKGLFDLILDDESPAGYIDTLNDFSDIENGLREYYDHLNETGG